MIEITNYHLDTLRLVANRLAKLANAHRDNRYSFCVELSSRPCTITATAFEWSDNNHEAAIIRAEQADWFFDRDPDDAEQNRRQFLATILEWEEKYGLE